MSTNTTTTTTTWIDLDAVRAAYASADKKGKAAMRSAAQADLLRAVDNMDLALAQAVRAAQAVMVTKTDTPEIDLAAVYADRVATLQLALDLMKAEAYEKLGAETWEEKEEGTPDTTEAQRLAVVKVRQRPAFRGTNGVVADFIADALEEIGHAATVREIAKSGVDYAGNGDAPTDGAIAACLGRDNDDRFHAVTLSGKVGAELTA